MIAQRAGAIVDVSSAAGVTGVRGGAGYSAAKSGLQMLTRITAAEWGRHGIHANCIAVGLVASERAVAAWKARTSTPSRVAASIPLGRVGLPADVAYPILFLCCEASGFVSGQTFNVDGSPPLGGPSQAGE